MIFWSGNVLLLLFILWTAWKMTEYNKWPSSSPLNMARKSRSQFYKLASNQSNIIKWGELKELFIFIIWFHAFVCSMLHHSHWSYHKFHRIKDNSKREKIVFGKWFSPKSVRHSQSSKANQQQCRSHIRLVNDEKGELEMSQKCIIFDKRASKEELFS